MKQNRSHQVSCFKHWTRKNYAVFNSLGKQIKIGVLATSCSLIALGAKTAAAQSQAAQLQQDSTTSEREQTIEEVVVDGGIPMVLSEKSSVLAAWSRSEIAELPVQNVQQLLEQVANIDLRQRGGNNVQADVRMRGGSEEQVLILLNGINIADPRTGHHSLNLPVDLANVERIEIIQMPGAFAGAVNIVTGNALASGVEASIGSGSHNYSEQAVSAHYVGNRLNLNAGTSLQKSTGYIYNTDFETVNAMAQGGYRFNNGGKIEAQFGFQQKAFGANNFYSVGKDEYEHVRTFISSLSYLQNVGALSLQGDVYHRRSFDNYCKHRDSLSFAQYNRNQDNYHQGDVVGGNLYVGYRSRIGKTTLGLQSRAEHIYSNKLGEQMDNPRPSFESGIDYIYEKWRTTVSVFLKHSYSYRRWLLAGSVVGNYSNSYGYFTQYNAQLVYSLLPQWEVLGDVHQSLRLPTFTDLYYNGAGYLPNPTLRPERATTLEIGTRYRHQWLQAGANAFYRMGSNLIDWVYVDDATQQCRNHVKIATTGIEAMAGYKGKKYLKHLSVSYAFLNLQSPQELDEKAKGRLFAYLRHKVSLSGAHHLVSHLQALWTLSYEQREGTYKSQLKGVEPTPFEPVCLVDAQLLWQQSHFSIYVSMDNVLNTQYYDYNAVLQSGRWLKTGIKVFF
ncbi:hypothetical protein AGMMS4956_02980 [Bacteroidia bacterium]|nr:hypothetical protein AGMMS4956_02980 [Bacteroidia bacterium]